MFIFELFIFGLGLPAYSIFEKLLHRTLLFASGSYPSVFSCIFDGEGFCEWSFSIFAFLKTVEKYSM